MAFVALKHPSLNATLQGLQTSHNNIALQHYRGIRYATIPGRFQKATAIENWDNVNIDCTRFGCVPRPVYTQSLAVDVEC